MQAILNLLQERGERMSKSELKECFRSLLGGTNEGVQQQPIDYETISTSVVNAKEFAEDILGFHDYS